MHSLAAQLIGGPTVLLEYAGLRWLTDPALSPPGHYGWLEKTAGPALEPVAYAITTPFENGADAEVRQGDTIIRAAQAGLPRLILASVPAADRAPLPRGRLVALLRVGLQPSGQSRCKREQLMTLIPPLRSSRR